MIISHDLSSLAGIADRVAVLYRGRIVEDGPVGEVFTGPRHPYTALLMASAPSVKHDRELSVHQLRRTAADPDAAPPVGRGRVRVRRALPVRDRRLRRPAGARAGARSRRRALERGLPPPRGVAGPRAGEGRRGRPALASTEKKVWGGGGEKKEKEDTVEARTKEMTT